MSYEYIVLGAGIQGTAIAYDMAKFGEASRVRLLDLNIEQAKKSSEKINQLLNTHTVEPGEINVKDEQSLKSAFKDADVCLSAVPYHLNPFIAKCAVETQTHFCDLGGNTDIVFKELELHEQALEAGVSVIPDCGLMPGMGNTLAAHGIQSLDECHDVQIRCGGLPQNPHPPLDYMLVFSIEGLTNEYFGEAVVLRDGKITKINTFEEHEILDLPEPLGKCEAFTTSGGTSTCPWTYEGKVKNFEYKTIRYPGHYEKFKLLLDLGLLDLAPVKVGEQEVVPRDVFHRVVTDKLTFPEEKDMVILRTTCTGVKDGKHLSLEYTVMDYFDDETGFNAMSRTTGFPASIVAIMMAKGLSEKGAVPLEKSIPAGAFIEELKKRGVSIEVKMFV